MAYPASVPLTRLDFSDGFKYHGAGTTVTATATVNLPIPEILHLESGVTLQDGQTLAEPLGAFDIPNPQSPGWAAPNGSRIRGWSYDLSIIATTTGKPTLAWASTIRPSRTVETITPGMGTATSVDNKFETKVRPRRPIQEPFPPVHPSPPTVVHGTTAQLVDPRNIISASDDRIRKIGDPGVVDPVSGKLSASGQSGSMIGMEFYTDGDRVEIAWYELVSNGGMIWIWVDGQPLTPEPSRPLTTSQGTRYFAFLNFGTAARRKITFHGATIGGIGFVTTPTTATVSPTPPEPRLGWVGDSFSHGTTASHQALSLPFTVSRALGMEVSTTSLGGSGYTTGANGNTFGSTQRVSDIVKKDPGVLVIYGSVNDGTAGLAAACTATYDAYAAALPDVPIIVFGPQPSSADNTLTQSRADANRIVRDAALVHPQVIAFHDLIGTADGVVPPAFVAGTTTYQAGQKVSHIGAVWAATSTRGSATGTPGKSPDWKLLSSGYFGTGMVGATTGDGTRDSVLAGDGVHPTVAGSRMLAELAAPRIVDALAGANISL